MGNQGEARKRRKGWFLIKWVDIVIAALLLLPIVVVVGEAFGVFGRDVTFVPDPATRAQGEFNAIDAALSVYERKCLRLPTTEQGLGALVDKPEVPPIPRQWSQQMRAVPIDPWGTAYHYTHPGIHNVSGYDLVSAGADGVFDTADDIGNWMVD